MSTESMPFSVPDYDDSEDRLANQAGSYADVWRRPDAIDQPDDWAVTEADKQKTDKKGGSSGMSSARRRRIALVAIGPQHGDDALPVADQTQDKEGYDRLHEHAGGIADTYFEANVAHAREEAVRLGNNPDAVERGLREKRAKRNS